MQRRSFLKMFGIAVAAPTVVAKALQESDIERAAEGDTKALANFGVQFHPDTAMDEGMAWRVSDDFADDDIREWIPLLRQEIGRSAAASIDAYWMNGGA